MMLERFLSDEFRDEECPLAADAAVVLLSLFVEEVLAVVVVRAFFAGHSHSVHFILTCILLRDARRMIQSMNRKDEQHSRWLNQSTFSFIPLFFLLPSF